MILLCILDLFKGVGDRITDWFDDISNNYIFIYIFTCIDIYILFYVKI